MQQKQNNNTILDDKALAEALFSNTALTAFDAQQKNAPDGYFENFEKIVLSKAKASKKTVQIFTISSYGKIAIAASLLAIAAVSFLFVQNNQNANTVAINVNLQDIPTAEIDNYVNANELIAEMNWQEEINNETSSLDQLNEQLIKDSNHIQ